MADNYYPDMSSPQKEDSEYPDIDETVHYPWQHGQPIDDGKALSSVLDPRLFGDHTQPPQPLESINQPPAEAEEEIEEEFSSGEYDQQYPPVPYVPGQFDEAASDNDFVISGEEETDRYVDQNPLSG
jgi:general transcription factor 3C polypeptide 3 (transcription factor C subunit 4)